MGRRRRRDFFSDSIDRDAQSEQSFQMKWRKEGPGRYCMVEVLQFSFSWIWCYPVYMYPRLFWSEDWKNVLGFHEMAVSRSGNGTIFFYWFTVETDHLLSLLSVLVYFGFCITSTCMLMGK